MSFDRGFPSVASRPGGRVVVVVVVNHTRSSRVCRAPASNASLESSPAPRRRTQPLPAPRPSSTSRSLRRRQRTRPAPLLRSRIEPGLWPCLETGQLARMENYERLEKVGEGELSARALWSTAAFIDATRSPRGSRHDDCAGTYGTVYKCRQVRDLLPASVPETLHPAPCSKSANQPGKPMRALGTVLPPPRRETTGKLTYSRPASDPINPR